MNRITVRDIYPLLYLKSFQLKDAKIISKMDPPGKYHQISMHKDDIEKTAIATPFGLFESDGMAFGLRNAGNIFQS